MGAFKWVSRKFKRDFKGFLNVAGEVLGVFWRDFGCSIGLSAIYGVSRGFPNSYQAFQDVLGDIWKVFGAFKVNLRPLKRFQRGFMALQHVRGYRRFQEVLNKISSRPKTLKGVVGNFRGFWGLGGIRLTVEIQNVFREVSVLRGLQRRFKVVHGFLGWFRSFHNVFKNFQHFSDGLWLSAVAETLHGILVGFLGIFESSQDDSRSLRGYLRGLKGAFKWVSKYEASSLKTLQLVSKRF